jgi:hypothetical protein
LFAVKENEGDDGKEDAKALKNGLVNGNTVNGIHHGEKKNGVYLEGN